jgi:hypothetical protein
VEALSTRAIWFYDVRRSGEALMLRRVFIALAAFAASASPALAQAPLFAQDSEVSFTIEAPLTQLVRAAPRSTEPYPAIVTWNGVQYPIELSARGFTRRTGGYCAFPPLRLNFDAATLAGGLLEGQNKLKLVTQCGSSDSLAQLPVLEHLAYRLYNVITPLSYRVRAAQVTYRDTSTSRYAQNQFNFLIEDIDDTAARNNLVALEVGRAEINADQLNPEAAANVAMFQFMIGNLDWEMVRGPEGEDCCHNGKLMAADSAARVNIIPVPYDFDYSGFVNAPYAVPPARLRVANVRVRYYRGYCMYNDQARVAAELYRSRRAELYALIDGEARLSEQRRESAHNYLDRFFEILDDSARFDREIIEHCRG